jgi:ABC-type transport system substrate-binding protein
MASRKNAFSRRDFLKRSALAGLGVWTAASWPKIIYSASTERLTTFSSVSLSSLDPYAFSSSPEYGIWNHIAESLVEVDYVKMDYVGVLAESWEFQAKTGSFISGKTLAFTMARRLPPKT